MRLDGVSVRDHTGGIRGTPDRLGAEEGDRVGT